jgi:hypothetical protein
LLPSSPGGEDQLGTEHLQHLTPLDRHAGGHEDLDRIALDLGDRGEGDTGVARRRLDDGLARLETPVLLGLLDHVLRDAVLDRAERVLHLQLGDDANARVRRQGAHVHRGRVADEIEHAVCRDHVPSS